MKFPEFPPLPAGYHHWKKIPLPKNARTIFKPMAFWHDVDAPDGKRWLHVDPLLNPGAKYGACTNPVFCIVAMKRPARIRLKRKCESRKLTNLSFDRIHEIGIARHPVTWLNTNRVAATWASARIDISKEENRELISEIVLHVLDNVKAP